MNDTTLFKVFLAHAVKVIQEFALQLGSVHSLHSVSSCNSLLYLTTSSLSLRCADKDSMSDCTAHIAALGLMQARTLLLAVCHVAKIGCMLLASTSISIGLWWATTAKVMLLLYYNLK